MLLKHAPDAEVIPVAIDGSWKLQCYRYGPLPFGVHIRAQISEPLSREGKNSEEIVAELEARVREMLNELRQA